MEEVPLGLYIVRGDHMCALIPQILNYIIQILKVHSTPNFPLSSVIGELDVEADAKIDWTSIRAEPLDEVRH
jgi:hypothetical protein